MKSVVWRSKKNRLWYFHFQSANGRVICSSEGYKRRAGALNAIRALRVHAATSRLVLKG